MKNEKSKGIASKIKFVIINCVIASSFGCLGKGEDANVTVNSTDTTSSQTSTSSSGSSSSSTSTSSSSGGSSSSSDSGNSGGGGNSVDCTQVRYKDSDKDGLVVSSGSAVCSDSSTYTIAASSLTSYQLNNLDSDDTVANNVDISNMSTVSESSLGVDVDGDGSQSTSSNIYTISSSSAWMSFVSGCHLTSTSTFTTSTSYCTYKVYITNDINFADLDGSSYDAGPSGDGLLTIDTPINLLAAGYSSLKFGGFINGGGNAFKNLKISISGSFSQIGGVVGYVEPSSTAGCPSKPRVQNIGLKSSSITTGSGSYIGGIIGRVGTCGQATSLYNEANISSSGPYVGGLIGYIYPSTGLTITNLFNSGNVTSTHASGNVGGLFGYASIGGGGTHSWTNGYNIGQITGATKVGGLIGDVNVGSTSSTTVAKFYNAGFVKATASTPTVGSITSKDLSTNSFFTDSYFLENSVCGTSETIPSCTQSTNSSTAAVKTSTELKTQSTYSNWDFTNIWRIQSGSYPYLRAYSAPTTVPGI